VACGLAVLLAHLAGCGGSAGPQGVVVLLTLGASTVAVGGQVTAVATVTENGSAKTGATVAWSSAGQPVQFATATSTTAADGTASVTIVAGNTPGTAQVTAASGSSNSTAALTITAGFGEDVFSGVAVNYVQSRTSQIQGTQGVGTIDLDWQALGNSEGGANLTGVGANGAGLAAFRIILAAAPGAAGRSTFESYGAIRLCRFPGASTRAAQNLTLASSGFDFDAGSDAPAGGVPGAIMNLRGVIRLADNRYVEDPTLADQGPITDLSAAEQVQVVTNYAGDIMLPPMPELPQGWAYRFLLSDPEGNLAAAVDVQTETDHIALLSGTIHRQEEFGNVAQEYRITDYYPLAPGTVFYYSSLDLIGGGDPIDVHRTVFYPSTYRIPNQLWALWGYPMDDADLLGGIDWWDRNPDGLTWCGMTGARSPDPEDWESPFDSAWYYYVDPPLLFPNDVTVGQQITYDTVAHYYSSWYGEEVTASGEARCQIQSVGDREGDYTDTVTALWSVPVPSDAWGGQLNFVRVVRLARGVGVLWEEWKWVEQAAGDDQGQPAWLRLELQSTGQSGDMDVTIEQTPRARLSRADVGGDGHAR